jgi:hypothetical protein
MRRRKRWTTLRAQVYTVDPSQPVMDLKAVETLLAEFVYARPRFNLLLFAVLGLMLALFSNLWRDLQRGDPADAEGSEPACFAT